MEELDVALSGDPHIAADLSDLEVLAEEIHEILEEKGLKQKDLALRLGKSEAEISKWMRGTHNFTIDTLVSIEDALDAPILKVIHQERPAYEFEPMVAAEP